MIKNVINYLNINKKLVKLKQDLIINKLIKLDKTWRIFYKIVTFVSDSSFNKRDV